MKVLETKNAPGAIGPYSQGFEVNGFIYTSGQIPVDPATGEVPAGIAAQAEQSCKNVGAILDAAGVSFEQVFKTTCFLADMGDFFLPLWGPAIESLGTGDARGLFTLLLFYLFTLSFLR